MGVGVGVAKFWLGLLKGAAQGGGNACCEG